MWWTAIIRDRFLALGLRRPTRIRIEDSDVPMLSIQDFDLELAIDENALPGCSVLHDFAVKRSIAETCIQLTKLCLCIGDVLTAKYSEQDGRPTRYSFDMQKFLTRNVDSKSSMTEMFTQGLQGWTEQLPPSLHLEAEVEEMDTGELPVSLVVHRALIHMLFYATVSALHRSQVLSSVPTSGFQPGGDEIQEARAQLRRASNGTMRVVRKLIELDYVRFLPISALTGLQSAVINQLLDLKATNEDDRRAALQGFCYCMRAVTMLREPYTAADHTVSLIEAAIRRADISVPVATSGGASKSMDAAEMAFFSHKKARNTSDLLAAAVMENLIPAELAETKLVTPPPEHSLLSEQTEKDTNTAAGFPTVSPNAQEFDLARRLESFLTTPLPAPEQTDYWSYAPAEPLNMSMPYDFDIYFNKYMSNPDDMGTLALDGNQSAGSNLDTDVPDPSMVQPVSKDASSMLLLDDDDDVDDEESSDFDSTDMFDLTPMHTNLGMDRMMGMVELTA